PNILIVKTPYAGFMYFWFISDAVFLILMVWSSDSTVLLLLRHHQRVQYIHTHTGHHRCPPETRAAHTTLMLVVTFIIFYVLNSIFSFYISALLDSCLWLIQTSSVLASCFSTVSPFQSLLRDPRTPRFCS
uniref:Vomeronasal type-1 receptor n=1 Tax=Capra hircus TaxID=9925 RepID=A0A8C2S5F6_CAPHI